MDSSMSQIKLRLRKVKQIIQDHMIGVRLSVAVVKPLLMLLSYISGNGTWLGRVGALVKMSPYITEQQRPTLRCVFVSPVSAQRDAFSLWG